MSVSEFWNGQTEKSALTWHELLYNTNLCKSPCRHTILRPPSRKKPTFLSANHELPGILPSTPYSPALPTYPAPFWSSHRHRPVFTNPFPGPLPTHVGPHPGHGSSPVKMSPNGSDRENLFSVPTFSISFCSLCPWGSLKSL